jgi:hypothetical protein
MTLDPLPYPAERPAEYFRALQALLVDQRYTKLELILIRSDHTDKYTHFAIVFGALATSAAYALQYLLRFNWWLTAMTAIVALGATVLTSRHLSHLGRRAAKEFDPLTPAQAAWIQQISAGDEHFRTIVARWVEHGTPILQRDYHSLKQLEVLARVQFDQRCQEP